MARILAIDWDHEFLHVIAGNTGRGGVSVDRAFVWSIGGGLTPQNGEVLGQKLREALKSVVDPELFVNIIDLGLVYDVKIGEEIDGKANVTVEMTMTSPACPAGPQLLSQSQDAVRRLDGVGDVDVKLVMEPPWTPDRMTEEARDQLGIF